MKRYNSVIGLLASIDHDHVHGQDITPIQIRQRLRERLDTVPDEDLLEVVGLTDTFDNKPEPDTRPLNVYRVSATDHVNWTCNVVARDEEEAYTLANDAAEAGTFVKGESYEFQIHAVYDSDVSHHGVKPTDDPHVWVMSDGETIEAFGQEDTNG